mgnify:FL=1
MIVFKVEKNGQAKRKKIEEKNKIKNVREREKRIKQKKKNDEFDLENEIVIQMTNRNNMEKEQKRIKELDKQEEKRNKRNKKVKSILKIILLLGVIIGGTIFSMTSPIFNIKEIQVTNNNITPSDTIISLSELKLDENIFKFNKYNVKNKIKENAYIEDVKIHRKIPNVVQIEITQRQPKYSIDFMGKYAYINSQGYILEVADTNNGLPIIQGIATNEEKIVPNSRLNEDDLTSLENIIKIMDIAKENNLDTKVTSIDITNKNQYSIYIQEEKKRIHLGENTNLGNKMLYAISIMEKEKGIEGDIYVNGDLNNKFQPYFREKV